MLGLTATLITRCGCEREMEVTYPPPPRLVLPLRTWHLGWYDREDTPNTLTQRVRAFELKTFFGRPGQGEATYYETE